MTVSSVPKNKSLYIESSGKCGVLKSYLIVSTTIFLLLSVHTAVKTHKLLVLVLVNIKFVRGSLS